MSSAKTQFQPGQSGNPGGRPKGFERQLREEIAKMRHAFVVGEDENGNPITEEVSGSSAIAKRLWNIVMLGEDRDSLAAAKLLYERQYGMAKSVQPTDTPEDDEDDESDLEGLSIQEQRILARVRALQAPLPEADGELH